MGTSCEKLPVEICGAGCVFEEGDEECHEKVLTSLVDVPEEVCDLNPQKICKFVTKLVPSLSPVHQCTIVPKETCILKFSQPKQVPQPLQGSPMMKKMPWVLLLEKEEDITI